MTGGVIHIAFIYKAFGLVGCLYFLCQKIHSFKEPLLGCFQTILLLAKEQDLTQVHSGSPDFKIVLLKHFAFKIILMTFFLITKYILHIRHLENNTEVLSVDHWREPLLIYSFLCTCTRKYSSHFSKILCLENKMTEVLLL